VRIFGCKAYAHIMNGENKKWDAKTIECILVGYSSVTKNYVLYIPKEKKYIEQAKHVNFIEESIFQKENRKIEVDEEENITVTVKQNEKKP